MRDPSKEIKKTFRKLESPPSRQNCHIKSSPGPNLPTRFGVPGRLVANFRLVGLIASFDQLPERVITRISDNATQQN